MEGTDAGERTGGYMPLAGMLWAYTIGVAGTSCLPQLPPWPLWLGVWGTLILPALFHPGLRRALPLLLAVAVGSAWSLWHNQQALAQRLPLAQHGEDFLLPVEIVSLPQRQGDTGRGGASGGRLDLRFTARVMDGDASLPVPDALRDQQLLLSWYRAAPPIVRKLAAGSTWILPVRLKRPRGSVNPHAFDYEGWLLRERVYATGYVRPKDARPRFLGRRNGVPSIREGLRKRLESQSPPRLELVAALLLGDRGGLSRQERRLLRDTGTAHLVAISGLHVGMVAAFFMLATGLVIRALALSGWSLPTGIAATCALAAALAYTLLAGAPLSAQRALAMTAVFLLALAWRRRISGRLAYAAALALVLTLQPLAIFSAGFWLSFMAVAALMLGFAGRRVVVGGTGRGLLHSCWRWLAGMTRAQWAVTLCLLVPSLYLFSGFSAIALAINLVAIPWMGLGILPLLMLGTLCGDTAFASGMVSLAGQQLDLLMTLLGRLDGGGAWQPLGFTTGIAGLVLAAVALALLSLPRGIPGRRIGWMVVLLVAVPALFPAGEGGKGMRVTVFDVGQGLAVFVAAEGERLVYDTGPRSRSGWNAGETIVLPYLLAEGVRDLDTVIVSHGDSDHRGGLDGILQGMPVGDMLAPGTLAGQLQAPGGTRGSACIAGQAMSPGALTTRVLWPVSRSVSGEENDHSCVLLLEWRGIRILLAGDISAKVEKVLVKKYPQFAPVDLLVAPHHGSRTSSSAEFIQWSRPRRVVFSAGFRHHFGHPHPDVVSRYRTTGATLHGTARSGALEFAWEGPSLPPSITRGRDAPRFWLSPGD